MKEREREKIMKKRKKCPYCDARVLRRKTKAVEPTDSEDEERKACNSFRCISTHTQKMIIIIWIIWKLMHRMYFKKYNRAHSRECKHLVNQNVSLFTLYAIIIMAKPIYKMHYTYTRIYTYICCKYNFKYFIMHR